MKRLYRIANWYNPLHVEVSGKEYELNSFCLYNDNGVILQHRGWLESGIEPSLDFEISKKVKEKFDKKIAYILKSKTDRDGKYDLYIHADLIGLKEPEYKISYGHLVMAKYKTDIEGFSFEKCVDSLDKDLNIVKKEIREIGKKLDSYSLDSKMLKHELSRLQELSVKLEEEEVKLSNYKIEDYLATKDTI